jgi:hypothetical protein
MDSHLLVVPPVSSSSKMSETKLNPILRELARCVAALSGLKEGFALLSPGLQRDTHRDTLREKTSVRYLYSVLILTAKRVRSRVDSHARGALW